jgi:hypothetical protein
MNDNNSHTHIQGHRRMTVANIREETGGNYIFVLFLESARFYKLYRNDPEFEKLHEMLRKAMQAGVAVHIGLDSPEGDTIQTVCSDGI